MEKINWKEKTTLSNYPADQVISSLQKDIRRGNIEQAAFWAYELSRSGAEFQKILWERLTTIAVEDISFGNPDAVNLIQSLKIAYYSDFEHDDDKNIQAMFAAAYMAKSPKDRFIDEMKNYFKLYEVKHEIPDYALDKHTKAGKEMGRSYDHFWLVGAKLNPESADRDKSYFKKVIEKYGIKEE